MKRKIIGHRGVAGLELENTATSLKRAVGLNVWAIEFDVRLTKDGKPVICHDPDLEEMAGDKRFIADLTLKELKRISLLDGSQILTLHEALKLTEDVPVIIDVKDNGCAQPVLQEIKKFPKKDIRIASPKLEELAMLRQLDSELFLYSIEHTRAFENVHLALQLKLNGIGMNYWLLNPLTYWYARRSGLVIYVYTVNKKPLVRFLSWLYPDIAICTDHPEWFVSKRRKSHKVVGAIHARRVRPR